MTTGNGHMPGLCRTCQNMATCALREHRGYDAMFCETFELAAPPEPEPRSLDAYAAFGDEEAGGPRPKGLCFDCENRDHCTLSTAEGGVWECEDYR